MDYLAERQDVLSQTIANSDTPGFKPKDLKKLDFEKLADAYAKKLDLRVTQGSHIDTYQSKGNVPEFEVEKQKKTFERKPVENAVNLQEQMMKVNENAFDYLTTTNLYNKTVQLFKTAIGNRG